MRLIAPPESIIVDICDPPRAKVIRFISKCDVRLKICLIAVDGVGGGITMGFR
jgi:hypothetical protein